jgi:RNA-splicing ligase RtcB
MIDEVEETCAAQITEFINHPAFTNPVAIMPDTHAGKTPIGFTMKMTDKIIPNTIGVDIGCGMLSLKLGKSYLFLDRSPGSIDTAIRQEIPFGFEVRDKAIYNMEKKFPWGETRETNRQFCLEFNSRYGLHMIPTSYNYVWFLKKCDQINAKIDRTEKSLGTLGGGNHFIEIGKDTSGNVWLTIHTGSRKFGLDICNYWQNVPAERMNEEKIVKFHEGLAEIKSTLKGVKISKAIKKLRADLGLDNKVAKALDYIEGVDMCGYLTDMIFAQAYAAENRRLIAAEILNAFNVPAASHVDVISSIETVHNYIDFNDFVIRKGAISAHAGELMIIPFNMEDGILLCVGKGNEEWNQSAPHGAGRVVSRTQAKRDFSSEVARERMEKKGIYTSAVPTDEVKEAYKDPKIIEEAIEPTAAIIDRIKPVINLKDLSK